MSVDEKLFSKFETAGFKCESGAMEVSTSLTVASLSGVIKAAAGLFSGGATTTDLPEGTNLYYTEQRISDLLVAGPGISISPITGHHITISSTSVPSYTGHALQYLRVNSGETAVEWHQITTSDVPEGSNLYWTGARFDTAFSAKTTTDLTEGANLYFTTGRVDTEVSSLLVAGTGITISSLSGGHITIAASTPGILPSYTGNSSKFLRVNSGATDVEWANLAGTANRITYTASTATFDISASYVGQSSITTLGTIGTGTWQGSSISTTFTDAKIKTVTGTANRLTIGGTATDPTFDIAATYVGQSTITTLGTITTGIWHGTTIDNAYLSNSSITVTAGTGMSGGGSVSLGGTITLTNAGVTSISGTSNRLTASASTGAVTLDISASYVGQSSITTLGTVGTGVWQGTKVAEAYGGTNQSTYTLGDILYASAANTLSKLSGNTTSTRNFLRQTGTGTISAAPVWDTLVAGDIPSLGANPSVSVGLSAVNGSASTYMRSDAAPALSQAITPSWSGLHTFQACIKVNTASATVNAAGTWIDQDGIYLNRSGGSPIIVWQDGSNNNKWSMQRSGSDGALRLHANGSTGVGGNLIVKNPASGGTPSLLIDTENNQLAVNASAVATGSGITLNQTVAINSNLPLYVTGNSPTIGLNSYYSAGWKYGSGSTAHYAGNINFDPTTGQIDCWVSSGSGAAGGAVSGATDLWYGTSSTLHIGVDLTMDNGKNIILNTSTGTKIGTGTTQKLGFYNVTPIAQRSGAAQAAVVTTSSTQTTPWGYSTQAQADAIVTLVNELRAWAVAQGFIKGSA